MATRERGRNQMSRRALLSAGFLAVPVAAALIALRPGAAGAQQKMAPKLVQYQTTPKNKQQCSTCLHFVAPDSCKMVEGKILPAGWCSLYAPKPK
jgi:hypothetical protein